MAEQVSPDIAKRVASMQRPIAGQSLTNDPDSPQAFEKAPEYTDMPEALDHLLTEITEDENRYSAVMTAVDSGMPVMDITKMILYDGFQKGKWNPDLLMILAEPLAFIIMGLAERAGIEYTITRDKEDEEEGGPVGLGRMDRSIRESKPSEESLPPEIKEKVENVQVPERTQQGPSLLGEQ